MPPRRQNREQPEQPEQPDFDAVERDFRMIGQKSRSIGRELRNCRNVPQLAGAEGIMRLLVGIRGDLRLIRRDMAAASNEARRNWLNTQARLENSSISREEQEIFPLVNINTGGQIPGFPRTRAEVATLTALAVNTILEALQLDRRGQVAEKKRRVRRHIGLQEFVTFRGVKGNEEGPY